MLKGKVAVITGGTRGIGNAIAKKYAENGANLAVIATKDNEKAQAAIEELKKNGTDVKLYLCDIKNADQVASVSEAILADFGGVDIVVNNAGITRDNLLPGLSIADIDDVIDINLKGTMYVTRSFIRNFIKRKGGNIINISSVVGLMGNKGQANYAASKAGIVGFTKTVAKEYGRKNIRCNAIAPGFIKTEMTDALPDSVKEEAVKQIPLGSFGEVEDIAEMAVFLASDRAKYITGQVICVDGGVAI